MLQEWLKQRIWLRKKEENDKEEEESKDSLDYLADVAEDERQKTKRRKKYYTLSDKR